MEVSVTSGGFDPGVRRQEEAREVEVVWYMVIRVCVCIGVVGGFGHGGFGSRDTCRDQEDREVKVVVCGEFVYMARMWVMVRPVQIDIPQRQRKASTILHRVAVGWVWVMVSVTGLLRV